MANESNVTMREVALEAGVSVGTVSKSLRNDPTIPEATRERVQRTAEKMGYRPNPLVSALMSQVHTQRPSAKTPILVALGQRGTDGKPHMTPVSREYFAGARKRAAARGYAFEHQVLEDGGDRTPGQISRQLRYRGVIGIMILPLHWHVHQLPFDFSHFASVALGRSLVTPRLDRVSPHQSANVLTLFRALREKGYRRVGLVLRRGMSEQVEHSWLGAYLRLGQFNDGGFIPPHIPDAFEPEAFCAWFSLHQPDAIMINEREDVDALLSRVRLGRKQSPHIYMLGRRNDDDPPGIDELWGEVGAAATDVLIEQVHANRYGLPPHPKTIFIEGRLAGVDNG
jgi:LacI family transcriptional regulator